MTCPNLPTEDLVAWLDGELPAGDAARVEGHVAACADCAREADLLRRSGEMLAALPGLAPSAGFGDRVVAAVRPAAPAPRGRLVPGRFPRWGVAAAAAVLVAAPAYWLATRGSDPARLSASDEDAIARDLLVIAHLDTLQAGDDEDLAGIADDLDVLDNAAEITPDAEGG